jgi:GWxTD domain-containing protein
MWLPVGHDFLSVFCSINAESIFAKMRHPVSAAHFRLVGLICFLLSAGFMVALENANAQMPANHGRPAGAADFDQTVGMPPYVFRTYQFAAAKPGQVRVEIFIGMVNDILQFVKISADSSDETQYRAQYEVNITIWDKQKNPVDSRNWKRELIVKSFDATNDRKKLNLEHAAFDLPPGEYEMGLDITDRDTGKNLRERRPLQLTALDDKQLQFSSIVFMKPAPEAMAAPRDSLLRHFAPITMSLAVAARPPDEATAPTAHNTIGSKAPDGRSLSGAAAYFEIYGAPTGESLQLHYQLLDWRRQVQAEWQETLTVAQTPVRHVVDFAGKIKQAGLHTFNLTIKRSITAKQKDVAAEGSFQVQISAEPNYAAAMGENKALWHEPLRYIAKGAEYKRIVETSEAGRDSLIAAFWQRRDPDPATSGNELRDEFYRRVAFADMRFAAANADKSGSQASLSGWESDRGRIYIKYGPPREVHHQFAEQGAAPYEIWLYPDLDLSFIFRDKNGSGDFELVNR